MNTAIFGGSFNPVHFGHFEMIRQADLLISFEKIIIVPAYKNPLKEKLPAVPEKVRMDMLKATFVDFKNVEISLYELNRHQTSYTYSTLEHFKKLYPDHQLYLILGEDSFASFHLWANTDRITELCNILAFERPAGNTNLPLKISKPQTKVVWSKARIPDISATEIRNAPLETVRINNWIHPNAFKHWEKFRLTSHSK